VPKEFSLYLLFLTIIGGSIISNTSGIKFLRIYILLKATFEEILKLVKPNNIINRNILFSDQKITSENTRLSFLIFISFFASLFILSGILLLDDLNFENSFKLSILTLTNTANSNLYNLNDIDFRNLLTSSKIFIIIFMIIGKIELISFFLVIKKFFTEYK
jgi:trk system potassium uptake protein TrkH